MPKLGFGSASQEDYENMREVQMSALKRTIYTMSIALDKGQLAVADVNGDFIPYAKLPFEYSLAEFAKWRIFLIRVYFARELYSTLQGQ